jgi:aspartate aminotransferase
MRLADRVNRINISATGAVMAEAERLKARGADVVDFGPGEPDFPTPEHVKRAAVRAIEENLTKYTPTPGIAALREAVCEWHRREFGSDYTPAECIISVGGKHAIFNAVCALINHGDEVVVPSPYWVSFPDIVKFAGGVPVFAAADPANSFRLRAADVAAVLTPRTRMVILNSPNNPTGAAIEPEEFARIFEICRQRDLWLLSDETYAHLVYDGWKPFSAAQLPDAKSHLILVNSFSKTFSMTGWRIGFTLAPEPLVQAMTKLQSQSTSNPTSIAQHAALEAARGPMDSVAAMCTEYERRRARILEGLRAILGIECATPDGAFYVFPNVQALLAGRAPDTTVLAQQLLEQEQVIVVPGEAFGAPGYLRLSYAVSMERIEEGLRRLQRFFAAARAAS